MESAVVSGPGEILISIINFSKSGIFYFKEAVDNLRGFDIESFLLLCKENGDYLRFNE